ncbi:MAG TPA: hypothetical protein VGG99_28645 [Acetobacteraceae bacterium]|jgi:hypothetical protein
MVAIGSEWATTLTAGMVGVVSVVGMISVVSPVGAQLNAGYLNKEMDGATMMTWLQGDYGRFDHTPPVERAEGEEFAPKLMEGCHGLAV